MYCKFFDSDEKKILLKKEVVVKEYDIDELELPQQIYVTMLFGVHVLLESVFKVYDVNRRHKEIPCIKAIRKIVNEIWIQEIFIDYTNSLTSS